MRLHSLRVQAFGPFAGEQHIDFDRVTSSGLFLLDGPTGAGKSTVLDAITFALYGQAAHSASGADDRLHSHFAPAGLTPEVTLEFSVDGARHRVSRTPEHQRPKKSGTGTTRQAGTVHLQRLEGGSWVSRSSNKAEVAEQLAEVIGLTRDQFTQVVLLPQGEFATFLRANDDERRKLLSKLFGTHLYDRITEELDQRRAESVRGIEAAQVNVQACIAAAAEAAGLTADDAAALRELPTGRLTLRLMELAGALAAARTDADTTAGESRAAAERARTAHAAAVADADRLARFAAAVAAESAHEAARSDQVERTERLAAARRAEPVRPLLAAAREAAGACEQAGAAMLAVAPDADPDRLAAARADTHAEQALVADRAGAQLQHLVDREPALPALAGAVADARAAVATHRAELSRLAERQAALPGELEQADGELEHARHETERLAALRAEWQALERQLAAARTADRLHARLDAARPVATEAIDAHQRAVDAHQRLIELRLSGMAAELAGALRDGEACAVCGATEHPAPARPGSDAVTAELVEAAAGARDAAARDRDAATGAVQQLERELAAALALTGEDEPDRLRDRLTKLAAAIEAAETAATGLDRLADWKRVLDAEAESLARAHAAALAAHAAATERLAAATAEHDGLAGELASAAGGSPSVAARQRQLHAEAERCRTLAEAIGRLAAAQSRQTAAWAHAAAEATERGFPDAASAADAVLAEAAQASLAAQVETWAAESERLRAAATAGEFVGLNRDEYATAGAVERERARTEQTAAAQQAADAAARSAADLAERARHAAQRFGERRRDVTSALARQVELETSAAPVLYLAKLTKGMTGQRRVALTTYVLRHWFEQVVQAANLRLASMSCSRYELIRVDDLAGSGSRAQRTGLTLQVLDRHTGEQRSTHSLSGGETFYTSLALALGLADVVKAEAGGVDLDTLFIDEGFGSLDTDTLEEVMSVIDELRDRGRVIGIVSHVGELKDRIAERVEVRRRPDGSSELRVVA